MKDWGEYARLWQANTDWVPIEDSSIAPGEREEYLKVLGDEWGDKRSVDQFVEDFILPHIHPGSKILEIGSGGGRIVKRIAHRCSLLVCLDVEFEMASLCRRTLTNRRSATWIITPKNRAILPLADASLDFVYSFDTFVHLDSRIVYQYLREAARVLKRGAKMAAHIATRETPKGWTHFIRSVDRNTPQGRFGSFEYLESNDFLRMARDAQLFCLNSSLGRTGNFYYERDAVFLLQKE